MKVAKQAFSRLLLIFGFLLIALGISGYIVSDFKENTVTGLQEIKQPPTDTDYKKEFYIILNEYRQEKGLSQFSIDQRLEKSAEAKLTDMEKKQYYAHYDRDNVYAWHFIKEAGYNYDRAFENLAIDKATAKGLLNAWKKSKVHNDILLEKANDMGLAFRCGVMYQKFEHCFAVLHVGTEK